MTGSNVDRSQTTGTDEVRPASVFIGEQRLEFPIRQLLGELRHSRIPVNEQECSMPSSTSQVPDNSPDEIPNILDFSDPQSEYEQLMVRMEAAETVIFAYEDRDWAKSPAQKARLTEKIAAARAAWGKSRETHVVRNETDA